MSTPAPERWYDIGPHGYFDLVRLARRGRSTIVRVLNIFALFAALAVAQQESPGTPRNRHVYRNSRCTNRDCGFLRVASFRRFSKSLPWDFGHA